MSKPSRPSRAFPAIVLLVLGLLPAGQVWLRWVAMPALGVEAVWAASLLDPLGLPPGDFSSGDRP
ncbi:MAG TPA: hypothetical protein PKJ41_09585 [Bryobacteraceae bacterium]|nr:hypothetical protein [Bryobacteraceae bacterium]HPT27962.1 hypothetical protein [Bryobacteraceae bacterium]